MVSGMSSLAQCVVVMARKQCIERGGEEHQLAGRIGPAGTVGMIVVAVPGGDQMVANDHAHAGLAEVRLLQNPVRDQRRDVGLEDPVTLNLSKLLVLKKPGSTCSR